jgi:flagellar protein FlaI
MEMVKRVDHYTILRDFVKDENILDKLQLDEHQRIIEEYWVKEPFIKAVIVEDLEEYRYRYLSLEPTLSEDELEFASLIASDLKRVLTLRDVSIDLDVRAEILVDYVNYLLKEYAVRFTDNFYSRMLYYFFRNFFGFGVIDPLMCDEFIEDISCDGYDIPIFIYHKKYGSMETNIRLGRETLDNLVLKLAQRGGKHVSLATPIVDATLPDGSRLQATYGTEITPRGSSFTIRKFTAEPLTPIDLIEYGTIPSAVMAYLWFALEYKLSGIIVGETGSGKTTTLNAILMFTPPDAKIVSIEDTRELKLYHENWVAEVTRVGVGGEEIDMYDLLKTALRQRPDYIVVGEVRGREAQTLFQAMSTGHSCYSTIHAGDINQMVYRLENEPLNVPRSMIQFLDVALVQQMVVTKRKRIRRTREVNEILGVDPVDKNLLINQFVKWDPKEDHHVEISTPKKLEKIASMYGGGIEDVYQELLRRKEYLELMLKNGIRDYRRVTRLIQAYYRNPEFAFSKLK